MRVRTGYELNLCRATAGDGKLSGEEEQPGTFVILVQTERESLFTSSTNSVSQQIDLKGKVRSGQYCYDNLNWH